MIFNFPQTNQIKGYCSIFIRTETKAMKGKVSAEEKNSRVFRKQFLAPDDGLGVSEGETRWNVRKFVIIQTME